MGLFYDGQHWMRKSCQPFYAFCQYYQKYWRQMSHSNFSVHQELNSIEAEIDMRKLLFLGRLVTEPKMAPSVRNLLRGRTGSLLDKDVKSIGILPSICVTLNKYDLFNYFEIWFNGSTFPTYGNWKSTVKNRVRDLENTLWLEFCSGHSNENACCTSLLRKRLSIQILVLSRPLPGFGQSSSCPNQTHG